jgi:hypothetical protein
MAKQETKEILEQSPKPKQPPENPDKPNPTWDEILQKGWPSKRISRK